MTVHYLSIKRGGRLRRAAQRVMYFVANVMYSAAEWMMMKARDMK